MTIRDIFNEMSYGPAPESSAEAQDWLKAHGSRFGHWIDGGFTKPGETFETKNPATGKVLAEVTQGSAKDLDAAIAAARRAQPKWARLSGHQRAKHLYALARLVQKNARLLAVLETMDNGKPIRESRDIDVPLVARHFYYHAGLAQLLPSELPGMAPLGVCGAVIPWNFPLLMLAWKVAPALAAGNTIVLKPAEYTPLTTLVFAELSREAGLPKGVLNIVTGDGATGAAPVQPKLMPNPSDSNRDRQQPPGSGGGRQNDHRDRQAGLTLPASGGSGGEGGSVSNPDKMPKQRCLAGRSGAAGGVAIGLRRVRPVARIQRCPAPSGSGFRQAVGRHGAVQMGL